MTKQKMPFTARAIMSVLILFTFAIGALAFYEMISAANNPGQNIEITKAAIIFAVWLILCCLGLFLMGKIIAQAQYKQHANKMLGEKNEKN